MRTTVRLDDRLLRQLKERAASSGRTLTAVIDEALRQFVARSEIPKRQSPFRVSTFKGRLRPGVDLDDSAALLDLMEDPPASRRR
jgi:plasmid stability protein